MSAATIPRWLRVAALVLIYGGLLAAGHWGSGWLTDLVDETLGDGARSYELHVMIGGILFYALLLAIPFVPGMEISLALLALFGPRVAIAIYAATVGALTLSCLFGRLMPVSLIARLFSSLGLQRARKLVEKLQPLSAGQRLAVLLENAPKRIVPALLKHRYIAVIFALNMPGNAVVGGGGGIALLAGMSGLFTFPRFVAAVALAALPVPLFVMLTAA